MPGTITRREPFISSSTVRNRSHVSVLIHVMADDLAAFCTATIRSSASAKTQLGLREALKQKEAHMSLKLGKAQMPASAPRKDTKREMLQAVVKDADKTEGKDRDLVHGDGGTLELGDEKP